MENLIYNGDKYDRIFLKDKSILIKYSMIPSNIWKIVQNKNLDFLNIPTDIFELKKEDLKQFPNYKSKIYLPNLYEYETLFNEKFTENLNTEEILKQLRDVLLKIKRMHELEVIHTDLFSDNIMIDKNFDIKFIDLDQMIVDNFISEENIFFEDDISFEEKKKLSIIQDKVDILNLYMYYLIRGNFKKSISLDSDVSKIYMPKNISDEINAYINGFIEPSTNYYFIDMIDELIKVGYTSPILSLRKES